MASMTDELEGLVLDQQFIDQGTLVPPTTYEAPLFSVEPAEDGTGGAELVDPTDDGYAPIELDRGTSDWAQSGTAAMPDGDLLWTPDSGTWTTVVAAGIRPQGGNLWLREQLAEPKAPTAPASMRFLAAAFTWTLGANADGGWTDEAAELVARWLFRGEALTWPDEFEWRLCTTPPSASTPGTALTEEDGYQHLVIPNTGTWWVRTGSVVSNLQNLTWPEAELDLPVVEGLEAWADGVRWLWRTHEPSEYLTGYQYRWLTGALAWNTD